MKALFIILLLNCNLCKSQTKNPLFDKTLKKDSIIAEFTQLYNLTNSIHPGQFMFCY